MFVERIIILHTDTMVSEPASRNRVVSWLLIPEAEQQRKQVEMIWECHFGITRNNGK